MSVEVRTADGIAEVVIDFPPVNALPVQGWRDLAAAVAAAGAEPVTRAVILAAAGRGFCAGVDIKEMQRTEGHEALIGANQGCFTAFAAGPTPRATASTSAPTRDGDQRGGVVVPGHEGLDQRPGHRVADDDQHVDLVPLDRAPDLAGVEGGQQHDGLPGEQARQRGHLRVAVDERRCAELDELAVLQSLAGLGPLIRRRFAGDEVDAAGQRAPDIHGQALGEALEIADMIAANGPVAVRAILRVIRETEGMPENEAFALEAKAGMAVFGSEDAKEGPRAFAEQRRPQFRDG